MTNQTVTAMFSGGITSFEVVRRLSKTGAAFNVLFADTLTEDEDTHRFIHDTERVLGVTVTRIADGRDIWSLFADERIIGNSRVAACSRILKTELCLKWMKENNPDGVVALGLDWTEPHRIQSARKRWTEHGFGVVFPLESPPLFMKSEYMANARLLGVEPPRLYGLGFEHNNCGGACVRGGHGQWARLLATLPERFAYHERREQETRELIGKDVAILRDRTNAETRPLTLRELRTRLENGANPADDLFSCSCFSGDEQ